MTLEIITADVLRPFRHGFFTRQGGASSGVYAGLNCGHGSSDQRDVVTANRARVAEAMGVDTDAVATAHQVHSAKALVIEHAAEADGQEVDALVTATPGIAVSVLTADCQPVLFADPDARVVAAAHAGWKGAVDGVLDATLAAMEGLGAARDRIAAVIGPSIAQASYEVGPEFVERFVDDDSDNARFFANGPGDRALFDLPGYGLHRLRAAGVGRATWTRHNTYADPDRFYSYRRSVHRKEADYGRLIASIRI